ncbi:flagellar basal body rod protein FlgC [Candidatus Poribacteria bacterium]|nr:flagellar basal body rod protein FlgC [Candidatus Poribacteria bacterium]
MDLLNALDISSSGLIVQRFRMNLCAENLANIETTRTANGEPYRRKQIVISDGGDQISFQDVMMGMQNSMPVFDGAKVIDVVYDQTNFRSIHKPGHPDADKNGYVLMPNVNPIVEMADMLSATRAYEANITAFSSAKSMVAKALELGK